MKINIGIIGYGNMGSAIAERIKLKHRISVFEKNPVKTRRKLWVSFRKSIRELVESANVVVLAIKPQDFEKVLMEIKNYIDGKLLISIAAGITTDYIERKTGQARVVRAMPNMPAKIGQGMTCLCKGRLATQADLDFTRSLFDKLGKTLIINEDMMDAATAISGSGPGYFYDLIKGKSKAEIKFLKEGFINSLIEAAHNVGFSMAESELLTVTTAQGSMKLLNRTKLSAEQLRDQVASKGGTTEAALEVLHRGGSLEEAVKAALNRSYELTKGQMTT